MDEDQVEGAGSAVDNEVSSILGVDPPVPTTQPNQSINNNPNNNQSIEAQEGEAINNAPSNEPNPDFEKARHYETLVNDPEIGQLINTILERRLLGHGQPQDNGDATDGDPNPSEPGGDDFKAWKSKVEKALTNGQQIIDSQQREIALLRVDKFFGDNPDAKLYRPQMGQILKANPSIGLQNAYLLAKAKAGNAGSNNGSGVNRRVANPPAPSVEGGGGNPGGALNEDALATLAKRINNTKATKSMDDALDAIQQSFGL